MNGRHAWVVAGVVLCLVLAAVVWKVSGNGERGDTPPPTRATAPASLPLGLELSAPVELRSQPFPQVGRRNERWILWFSAPSRPFDAWNSLARSVQALGIPMTGSAKSCRLIGEKQGSRGNYVLGADVPKVIGVQCGSSAVGRLRDGRWAVAYVTLNLTDVASEAEFSLDIARLAPGRHRVRSQSYAIRPVPVRRPADGGDPRVERMATPSAHLRPGDEIPGEGCTAPMGQRLRVPAGASSVARAGDEGVVMAAADGRAALEDLADQIHAAGGVRPRVRRVQASTGQWISTLSSRISYGLCEAQTDATNRFVYLFTASD